MVELDKARPAPTQIGMDPHAFLPAGSVDGDFRSGLSFPISNFDNGTDYYLHTYVRSLVLSVIYDMYYTYHAWLTN